jgi:hypothetical protein
MKRGKKRQHKTHAAQGVGFHGPPNILGSPSCFYLSVAIRVIRGSISVFRVFRGSTLKD